MTPERKKWWDSLPQREKMLREELAHLKYKRSAEKLHAYKMWSITARIVALMRVNHYTAHIRALKHELDRTTVIVYVGRLEEGPIYQCKKCGGMFENFEQTHCCWCGRKIVGCK